MNDNLELAAYDDIGENMPRGVLPEVSHYTDRTTPITRNESERLGRNVVFYLKNANGQCPHGTTAIGLFFLPTGKKEVYCLGTNGRRDVHEFTLTDDEKKSIGTLANALYAKHVPGSTREEARMLRPAYYACEYMQ
jgi:hypothetical protein